MSGPRVVASTSSLKRHNDDPDDATDSDLLAAALREPAAFSAIYRRYVGAIYGYCYNRLGREDAEDATSQIFVQALSRLPTCRSAELRCWLFAIAHNHVIDRLRGRRFATSLDDTLELQSRDPSPEKLALDSDRDRQLWRAIRAVPPDQRAAVGLRLAGLTGTECAQVLGKSVAATRMLHHRAFIALRDTLSDLAPGPDLRHQASAPASLSARGMPRAAGHWNPTESTIPVSACFSERFPASRLPRHRRPGRTIWRSV
jgi:RNA polymerase sigma-70 factor (ECF subfamily)